MSPVVAEVIGIGEFLDAAINEGAELRGLGGERPVTQAILLWIRDGIALPIGVELKEMVVLERHHGLDDVV